MPLTEGLHNIPADDYHADPCPVPSLSNSIAHTIITQSPLHAWHDHPRLNPHHQPRESSRFDLGTAAHDLLLCRSGARIAVIDADDWRKNAAKAQRDEARANGLVPILRKHDHALNAMVKAGRRALEESEWKGVLEAGNGAPEQTLIWREGETWCRSLIDWLTTDRKIILDYKTTENANPEAWARGHITQMGYDMQSEFYRQGIYRRFNHMPHFVFMVQEISPPFAVSFVSLSEPMREIAQLKVERAVHLWATCRKNGKWPGYPTETVLAQAAGWALQEHAQYQASENLKIKPSVQHDPDRPLTFRELHDTLSAI